MSAPCLRDVAVCLGVTTAELADELRGRLEAVLDAAMRAHQVGPAQAVVVHCDLDALAEFVAAVRMDLPIPDRPRKHRNLLGGRS
ncbi:hypothetical protein ACPPVT_14430 [Angustibacter sp. McL0619]|uniref:hypothetical protein n=1 Tax=Angustibacter sp. McL0619 TaxID=3415676 RepID=UPI003CF06050